MQNRYEEYQNFDGNIPFVLRQDIKRSALQRSTEANWHDNIEIEYFTEGCGRVLIDGREYTAVCGDIIVINSGSIHHTGSDSEVTYSCLIIDSRFCRESEIDVSGICFESLVQSSKAGELFESICDIYNTDNSALRTSRLRMYTLELMILLCEKYSSSNKARAGESQNENAKRIMEYIKSHYSQRITLDKMAHELYMNKFVLSRQFKAVVGMTIFEYINSCRCNAAAMLIADGESVNTAARECGFENISFFTKTFKRFMGKLPSEFKKQNKAKIF